LVEEEPLEASEGLEEEPSEEEPSQEEPSQEEPSEALEAVVEEVEHLHS
jgi:hypothetical protein